MSDKSTIRVRRKTGIPAAFAKLTVLVDGEQIGAIANGKEEVYEVSSGNHAVKLKYSQPLDLELQPDQEIELECGISKQFLPTICGFGMGAMMLVQLAIVAGMNQIVIAVIGIVFIFFATTMAVKPGMMYYIKKIDE